MNEFLIIGLVSAFSISTILLLAWRAIPITSFIYTNARLHARSNYMVDENKIRSLVKATSLSELVPLLKGTDYENAVNDLRKVDIIEMHKVIEKRLFEVLDEVYEMSPESMQLILDKYKMMYESRILKIFYRTRFLKTEIDENMLFSVGIMDKKMIKHLSDTKSIADIAVVLSKTLYADILNKEYASIEEFEIALDNFVMNGFVLQINQTKVYEAGAVQHILIKKIDIMNILALLKLKIRNLDKAKQKNVLIENTGELKEKIPELIKAENIPDFVSKLEGTSYYEPMKEALEKFKLDNSYFHFETLLLKHYKEFVKHNDLHHLLGPYQILSYLFRKELEMRNLLAITKGIDEKIEVKIIEEMIV